LVRTIINNSILDEMLSYTSKALLKLRTGWSSAILNNIDSIEEAEIYIKAHLVEANIGGRPALIRSDIDWSAFNCRKEWLKTKPGHDYDKWKDWNNADLIGEGWPPRDDNGDPYQLHHIGQRQDSPFAELTWSEHIGDGNYDILHKVGEYSNIERQEFDAERSTYWQTRFKRFTEKELRNIYK